MSAFEQRIHNFSCLQVEGLIMGERCMHKSLIREETNGIHHDVQRVGLATGRYGTSKPR